jgi:hypothetical protein
MPTKKKQHLKIEIIEAKGYTKKVLVRVVSQSHRGKEFGENGSDEFISSQNFKLRSENCPEYYGEGCYSLCVRGIKHSYDNDVVLFPKEKLPLLNQAIEEYNKHFAQSERNNKMQKQDNFSALCKSLDTWYSLVQSRSAFGPLVSKQYVTGVVINDFTDEEYRLVQNAIFNLSPQIIVEAAKILAEEFEQHKKEWEEEKNDLLYIIDKLKNISEK